MKFRLYVITILFLCSCQTQKIEITSQYIINKHWDEHANYISIEKMRLKKDSVIDFENLNQVDIVNRLYNDSSFCYEANVNFHFKDVAESKKIYFNENNGFVWWSNKGEDSLRIIGNLEKENWYKFSGLLTYRYDVYVFIDSSKKTYR